MRYNEMHSKESSRWCVNKCPRGFDSEVCEDGSRYGCAGRDGKLNNGTIKLLDIEKPLLYTHKT